MALIKCKECGHMISDKATRCPKCGTPSLKESEVQFQPNMNQQPIHQQPVYYDEGDGGNNNKWSYYVIALLLAAMAGGGYYFYDKNKQQEEYFQQKLITDSIARDSIGKVEQARQDSIELARNTEEKKQKAEKEIALDSYLNCPDGNHPHKIDLGLPSGTKWACCNVGAYSPEDGGGHYAWGETEEKDIYDEENYLYYHDDNGDGFKDYDEYRKIGIDICGTKYDVAHIKWGGSWQMPSKKQMEELNHNCSSTWATVNGIEGRRFTSKLNSGSIFLPAAGCCYESRFSSTTNNGAYGCYWSGSLDHNYIVHACGLLVVNSEVNLYYYWICDGYTIRPVTQ